MNVIMLAAGIGQRLKSNHSKPKCLLEFNGMSLLARHITALDKHPVSELLIITGYKNELIKNEIDNMSTTLNINLIFNPEYEKGSVLSLLTGCNNLDTKLPVILMDADVLYHPNIIDILFSSQHENIFLLDRDFEPGDEPVKLCVSQGKIIEFRKQLPGDINFDIIGESVGFFRFSIDVFNKLHKQAEKYNNSLGNNAAYEEVIRDILLENPDLFKYEDVTGVPWIEIDYPEDVTKAEEILKNFKLYK